MATFYFLLEAAWQELEYLASDGKMLLFVDNIVIFKSCPANGALNTLFLITLVVIDFIYELLSSAVLS